MNFIAKRLAVVFVAGLAVTGCATQNSAEQTAGADYPLIDEQVVEKESKSEKLHERIIPDFFHEADPWESFNRKIYAFNSFIDTYFLRPIAWTYDKITPRPLDQGITNFFANLDEINTVINDLLQGKFEQAWYDSHRFLLNSTFGFGGLYDFASSVGIEKHEEDFGQTLAVWGVGQGPYLVLPFIGPSSIRGAAGFAVDIQADPVRYIEQWELSTGLQALNIIDQRAGLIPAEAALEDVLDEYIVIRNVYLTRRAQLIADDPTAVAPEKEKSSTDEVDCEEIETVKEYEACVEAQQTL